VRRLLERGADFVCVDNFFTGAKRNIAHLLGGKRFELRHDVTFPLCGGRRDLQSRLPGVTRALPARPRSDHEDQRSRRHQHARPSRRVRRTDDRGKSSTAVWAL
jgi:hypothetical protein